MRRVDMHPHRAAALMLGLAVMLMAVSANCRAAQAGIQTIQLPPELDRVLRDYEAAWQARDEERLSALFHENGFALSPGRPPSRGREAILRHYRGAGGPLSLRALAYAAEDTIGYIVGIFGRDATHEGGKFLLALQRPDPQSPWLIAADMDNSISR